MFLRGGNAQKQTNMFDGGTNVSLDAICEQMGRTPPWAEGLIPRTDGYETEFYKKD